MQGENEEFPEFSEASQKNTSSESDRMEDSDGRQARDSALAKKEQGRRSASKEKSFEKLEFKQEPIALRTRLQVDKIPKLSTLTKGRKGSGRKRSATKPLEGEEEEENVECAKCAQVRGQWVDFKKTRDFSSIHSVLKHWLLFLLTMYLVWKPDAKLAPFELPDEYIFTWHEFKGLELRRRKDKTLFLYIFVNENDTNQTWSVLVRFDEFWHCFTQARTSWMITEINGLIESK